MPKMPFEWAWDISPFHRPLGAVCVNQMNQGSNDLLSSTSTFSVRAKWVFGLGLGKLLDTHYPYMDPNYPNPRYPILNSDNDFDYPKLVWVIRVISSGTRITRIFVYIFVFIMCC